MTLASRRAGSARGSISETCSLAPRWPRPSRRTRTLALLYIAAPMALLLRPDPSLAQTTATGPAVAADKLDPETRVLARELAIRGAEAFDAGDFQGALENFNRASSILDVPSIAVMQARTLVQLGRWIEGLDRFQQTARLVLDDDAPLPYREAVARAAAEAEALRKQIPQVAVLVDDTGATDFEIHFDDKVVHAALLNIPRPVDPGTHEVRAAAHGVVYFKRTLDAVATQRIDVSIPPPPKQPPASATGLRSGAAGAHGVSKVEPPADRSAGLDWPLYGSAALSGVGAVGAVTTAILASRNKARLEEACERDTGKCPAEYADDISALRTERTLFYVSTGLTVLAGGFAVYLWLTDEADPGNVSLRFSPTTASLVGHY